MSQQFTNQQSYANYRQSQPRFGQPINYSILNQPKHGQNFMRQPNVGVNYRGPNVNRHQPIQQSHNQQTNPLIYQQSLMRQQQQQQHMMNKNVQSFDNRQQFIQRNMNNFNINKNVVPINHLQRNPNPNPNPISHVQHQSQHPNQQQLNNLNNQNNLRNINHNIQNRNIQNSGRDINQNSKKNTMNSNNNTNTNIITNTNTSTTNNSTTTNNNNNNNNNNNSNNTNDNDKINTNNVNGVRSNNYTNMGYRKPVGGYQTRLYGNIPLTPNRSWRGVRPPQHRDVHRFVRVVSFNIMSDTNAQMKAKNGSKYNHPNRLHYRSVLWEHRSGLIQQEILREKPDIICLQEVDRFDFFEEKLAPRGYIGIYERKNPLSSIISNRGYVAEGLAIFWKMEKFELQGRQSFILGDPTRVNDIALFARLKRRDPNNSNNQTLGEIDIWNSQFHPGRGEKAESFRLQQAQSLFDKISTLSNTDKLNDKSIGNSNKYNFNDKNSKNNKENKNDDNDNQIQKPKQDIKDLKKLFEERMNKHLMKKDKSEDDSKDENNNENNENNNNSNDDDNNNNNNNNDDNNDNNNDENKENKNIKDDKKESNNNSKLQIDSNKKLKRPVILCIDFGGHSQYAQVNKTGVQVRPKCYAYLTHRSRTTNINQTYANVLTHQEAQQHKENFDWFLQSAYALGYGQEPHFTCYTTNPKTGRPYAKASDLILFSPQNFRVINLFEPLPLEWIDSQETRTLPCSNYPSDHFMIGVDFEIANGVKSQKS